MVSNVRVLQFCKRAISKRTLVRQTQPSGYLLESIATEKHGLLTVAAPLHLYTWHTEEAVLLDKNLGFLAHSRPRLLLHAFVQHLGELLLSQTKVVCFGKDALQVLPRGTRIVVMPDGGKARFDGTLKRWHIERRRDFRQERLQMHRVDREVLRLVQCHPKESGRSFAFMPHPKRFVCHGDRRLVARKLNQPFASRRIVSSNLRAYVLNSGGGQESQLTFITYPRLTGLYV